MAIDLESARAALKGKAYEALAMIGDAPEKPLAVRARGRRAAVVLIVRRAGAKAGGAPRRVGRWLSPTETLILTQLGQGNLTRVELARRCGMPCDMKFKTLVANLVERGILEEPDDVPGVRAKRM